MSTSSPRFRNRSRILIAVAAVGMLAAACSNSSEGGSSSGSDGGGGSSTSMEDVPGVTDDAINYAVTGTGAANPLGYCLLDCFEGGVQAYFDYINSEGGVYDRELTISRVEDDEMGNSKVALLDLIEDPDIFGIFSAPILFEGFAELGESGVPAYSTFPASPETGGSESIFLPGGTICIDCVNPETVHIASLTDSTKVASIGFGVSQASKDCADRVEREVDQYGAGQGVEFVYKNNELPYGFPNGVGPEVTAMKDAGVDMIVTCIDQNSVITLENELRRQEMDDVVVKLPQAYDSEYLETNAAAIEGDVLAIPYRPLEADPGDSEIELMTEWIDKAGVPVTDFSIQGWMDAKIAVDGLEAAGEPFDRASVIAATNELTDYTVGGLFQPYDWADAHVARGEDDPGRWCTVVLEVQGDGSLEVLGDPAEPWACWDLPLDEWADPEIVG